VDCACREGITQQNIIPNIHTYLLSIDGRHTGVHCVYVAREKSFHFRIPVVLHNGVVSSGGSGQWLIVGGRGEEGPKLTGCTHMFSIWKNADHVTQVLIVIVCTSGTKGFPPPTAGRAELVRRGGGIVAPRTLLRIYRQELHVFGPGFRNHLRFGRWFCEGF
jgi:hypothetical protein